MKYTEEIFNILSKGGFISANSVSPAIKRYYDAIEEDLTDYYEIIKVLVFISKVVTDIICSPVRRRKSTSNANLKQL